MVLDRSFTTSCKPRRSCKPSLAAGELAELQDQDHACSSAGKETGLGSDLTSL